MGMVVAAVTEPNLALLLAAAAMVALTGLVAVAAAATTRGRDPEPGPATMDLGPEAPAVVSLLVEGGEPEPEAVPATLIDLAARRFVDLDLVGAGAVMVRLRSGGSGPLLPHESAVLERLGRRAPSGELPAGALASGDAEVAAATWRRFRRAVVAEARAAGLCRPRYPTGLVAALGAGGVAGGALVALAAAAGRERAVDAGTGIAPGPSVLGVAVIAAAALAVWWSGHLARRGYQRLTPLGRRVAGTWLGVRAALDERGGLEDAPAPSVVLWDRYLAYAAAMGLARQAVNDLPMGAERSRKAWSHYGGRWRHVTVRYPKLRPGWGRHPVAALVSGVAVAGLGGLAARIALGLAAADDSVLADLPGSARVWAERGAVVAAVVCGLLAVVGVITAVLGVLDLPALLGRREVTGWVVRRRLFREGHWLPDPVEAVVYSGRDRAGIRRQHRRRERHYLALDTGHGDLVRAWRVRPSVFAATGQDVEARVRVTPYLGYVHAVEPVAPG